MATIISEAEEISATLEGQKAGERIAWLYETFGNRVVASSSFGLQAAVMLNLIAKNAPKIPVIFVDTGYLFPETYAYIEDLKSQLDVDIRHYVSKQTAAHQEAIYGKLWEQGAEGNQKYATLNKIEPMNRAIQEIGGDIWLSGLRRSQSSTRANRQLAEQQSSTLKVYPILDWADAQVASYFYENKLPKHPLEKKGYVTMGDWHSTSLPKQGEDAEATRYNGEKYECGLHEASGSTDFQI
ncbi:phosphoadenylyl-sulfate reductase [Akkermansiaceae bacterium]|nr:phosphoadenylyl-sulfate reductase [Akkermansiaceae bacterium]MDB4274214.1 phosphoadenylyl-sulfate reductase [Akkermansiaceae bacterium]